MPGARSLEAWQRYLVLATGVQQGWNMKLFPPNIWLNYNSSGCLGQFSYFQTKLKFTSRKSRRYSLTSGWLLGRSCCGG